MRKISHIIVLFLAGGLPALLPAATQQQKSPVCAVLPLETGTGVHAGQAGLVANQYSVALGRTLRYQVLPRYEVNRTLHTRGFGRGKFASSLKSAVAAGKALNADYVVVGTVRKTETGFALATSLVSINEARAAAAARNYHAGDFKAFTENATAENVRLLLGVREPAAKTPTAKPPEKKPAPAKPPKKEPRAVKPVKKELPPVKAPETKPPVAKQPEKEPEEPPEVAMIENAPKPPEITTEPPEIAAMKPPKIKPLPPIETELAEPPPVTVAPREPEPPLLRPKKAIRPGPAEKKPKIKDMIIAEAKTPAERPPADKVAQKKQPPKGEPPEKAAPERVMPKDDESPGWVDRLSLVCDDFAAAARGKLDIGMRVNHYIYQTEKDDFIGSIDTIEAENQYIYEDPLVDSWWPNGLYLLWRFSDTFATELTYTELRAITLSHGGNHTDGTVVTAGPILTALRRWPNDTAWVPYAGLGLAFFVSTHVTGDNPWHNGFGGRDWDGYNAWAEAGATPWPNGGYQRTFRVADELGYVLGLGLERRLSDNWSVDLNARYTYVVFENTYTLSFYGNQRGKARQSEWDLSNVNLGIGVKYSF